MLGESAGPAQGGGGGVGGGAHGRGSTSLGTDFSITSSFLLETWRRCLPLPWDANLEIKTDQGGCV